MTSEAYTLRDDYKQAAKPKLSPLQILAKIQKESGKSPIRIALDAAPLIRGPGKLTFSDYVYYRLFDESLYDDAMRARFISDHRFWKLMAACTDTKWWAATEDKWLLYSVLGQHGIPAPETLAVVDRGTRGYGRFPVLGTEQQMASFLNAAEFPLFLKPVKGIASSGALLVRGASAGEVELDGRDPVSHAEFFETVIGPEPYLIQSYITNHPEISGLSSHLATVRCYNFWVGDELTVRWTLFKMVGGDNIADNYWREGNMLAAVDPADGRLTRVVTGSGFSLRTLDVHPVSGRRFADMRLPYWQEVLTMNESCARLYAPIRFSSTDIAITPDGPVVVEVNVGGAFTLPQLATGRGLLTDEVAAFFGIKLPQSRRH